MKIYFLGHLTCRLNAENRHESHRRSCERRIFITVPTIYRLLNNIIRTSIYYCDPMASWQKPNIEKNHEYIRYVLPKGSSFDALTGWDATKLASHINSTARASLNGLTPIQLAQMLLDKDAVNAFGLREISPNDIILTPELLKK